MTAGSHECFDRIVLEFDAPGSPGWVIEYTDCVRRPGSGTPVVCAGVLFRVLVLDNASGGSRIVIDVAHRWS